MTLVDHKRLIEEGKNIAESINEFSFSLQKLFQVLGNLGNDNFVRSYWYKVKCLYCHELFVLYLLNRNLELSMKNLGGIKHPQNVERINNQVSASTTISTRRKGRPRWLATSADPSQATTLVSKSSQKYASKLHFITLFDNLGNLDYPRDF